MDNEFPRRARLDKMTTEEQALFNMVGEIEKLGAHPLLTDVVVLLGDARSKLSDWVDQQIKEKRRIEMEGLTVGRIVHYVFSESDVEQLLQKRSETGNASCNLPWVKQHYPAIVMAVFEHEYGQDHPGVNLQVFMDGNDSHWVTSRKYSEDKEPGTWHWIEKA